MVTSDRTGWMFRGAPWYAARGGIAVFVAVVVVEHALAAELSVERDRISEYAVRGVGWLMVAGFAAWAVALAATALLAVQDPRGLALAGLLVVAAGGMLLTASFPTQAIHGEVPAGVARTLAGVVHDLGSGAVLVALFIAGLLSMVTIPGARVAAAIAIALACVAWVGLPLAGVDAPALAQRMTVLAACLWHWTLAGALGRDRAMARPFVPD